jgi:hypothetical protein
MSVEFPQIALFRTNKVEAFIGGLLKYPDFRIVCVTVIYPLAHQMGIEYQVLILIKRIHGGNARREQNGSGTNGDQVSCFHGFCALYSDDSA